MQCTHDLPFERDHPIKVLPVGFNQRILPLRERAVIDPGHLFMEFLVRLRSITLRGIGVLRGLHIHFEVGCRHRNLGEKD